MSSRRPAGPPRNFARAISIAAHPLVLVPLTIALSTRNLRWTILIAAILILPLAFLIFWNVRRGVWSDFDVSRRDQRSGLYWAAIPLLVIAALVIHGPPAMMRGMFAAAAMLLIGLAGNRFLKTSMHMMFAAFCAVILFRAYPWSPLVTIPLVAAVAWSRRVLERHTNVEIAAGLLIGTAAGLVAFL